MRLFRTKSGLLVFTDEATLHNYDEHDEAVYTFEINYVTEYAHEVNAESPSIYKKWCEQEQLDWCASSNFDDYENRRKE
jgi:hypothetical protein